MYVTNPNILTLARKLELIPNVLQVRFYTPLREEIRDGYGGGIGCMIYQLMMHDLVHENRFEVIKSLIPAAVIDDELSHAGVIENLTRLVNEYQVNLTLPSRLAVGGQINVVETITTSSLYEQYQPEPVAPPDVFPSI